MEISERIFYPQYAHLESCSQYVGFIRPHMDKVIPARVWEQVTSALEPLPGSLATNRYVLEMPLDEDPEPVDFSVQLVHREMGPEILAHVAEKLGADEDPAWQAARRIACAWADPQSAIGKYVPDLWLEFDLFSAHPVSPNLFVHVMDERIDKFWAIYRALVACIPEKEKNTNSFPLISRCVSALPENRRITWLGIMLPRPGSTLRLCVHFPQNTVGRFLKAAGYPLPADEISEISHLFDRLNPIFRGLSLNMDLGEEIGPTIGFECFIDERDRVVDPRWTEALDTFVNDGLCTPEKRAAVLGFYGGARYAQSPNDVPASWWDFGDKNQHGREIFFIRRVSHLKIRYKPGERLRAKVYLGMARGRQKGKERAPSENSV